MIGGKRGGEAQRRARTRWRRSLTVVSLAVALGASACVPPPPTVPAPDLPAGVGVRWLRDTGGTIDPDEGFYSPSIDAYTLLNGSVTGPDAPDPPLDFRPTHAGRIGHEPDHRAWHRSRRNGASPLERIRGGGHHVGDRRPLRGRLDARLPRRELQPRDGRHVQRLPDGQPLARWHQGGGPQP